MHSRFVVEGTQGETLGIFPAPLAEHAAEVRAVVDAHPGSRVRSIVSIDDPCPEHPAFEVDNCAVCNAD